MRFVHPVVAVLLLSGCLPGMLPEINTGNTSTATEEAPDVKTNSDHRAPVFNITVYANPNVDAVGGRQTINGGAAPAEVIGSGVTDHDEPASVPPPTALRLDELAPIDKAGDSTLVGRVYGGLTVEDYNRMICAMVDTEERFEPVSPVWEGCRPYWKEETPSLTAGDDL